MKKILNKFLTIMLSSILVFSLISCSKEKITDTCSLCNIAESANKITYEPLGKFNPSLFDEDSFKVSKKTDLADGAYVDKITLNLNNGNHVIVNTVNVDLNKVSIKAGTAKNSTQIITKATPYQQVLDYEKANENETVLAAVNADFFGSMPINAFVKDGVIIKDSHNDNGIYDYKNEKADLPASMPMLFGISSSNKQAQIGAIVDNKSVEETVKTKFKYQLDFLKTCTLDDKDKISVNNVSFNASSTGKNEINFILNKKVKLRPSKLIKLALDENKIVKHGKIIEIVDILESSFLEASSDFAYILIPENIDIKLEVGNYVAFYVNSVGDKWKHYDTVIGARHALVLNGEIPNSVALEYSNGAKRTNVPRTAVGIKEDGSVVVITIESLRYYNISKDENDSYGVNLPELAEIMRYYGCVMACNFDGGGSTNMLIKEPNKDLAVWTRSADYGSYNLGKARPVINTLLVVKNKNEI